MRALLLVALVVVGASGALAQGKPLIPPEARKALLSSMKYVKEADALGMAGAIVCHEKMVTIPITDQKGSRTSSVTLARTAISMILYGDRSDATISIGTTLSKQTILRTSRWHYRALVACLDSGKQIMPRLEG